MVEQIVLNEQFPRSVIYSVSQLHRYFGRLKNNRGNNIAFDHLDLLINKLKGRVRFSTAVSIMNEGLHQYLYQTRAELVEIGNTLNKNYFA